MNRRIPTILLIRTCFLTQSCAKIHNREMPFNKNWKFFSGTTQEDVSEFRVVKGKWKFKKGDNLIWKNSAWDDSLWQDVMLPATWEDHPSYKPDYVFG